MCFLYGHENTASCEYVCRGIGRRKLESAISFFLLQSWLCSALLILKYYLFSGGHSEINCWWPFAFVDTRSEQLFLFCGATGIGLRGRCGSQLGSIDGATSLKNNLFISGGSIRDKSLSSFAFRAAIFIWRNAVDCWVEILAQPLSSAHN